MDRKKIRDNIVLFLVIALTLNELILMRNNENRWGKHEMAHDTQYINNDSERRQVLSFDSPNSDGVHPLLRADHSNKANNFFNKIIQVQKPPSMKRDSNYKKKSYSKKIYSKIKKTSNKKSRSKTASNKKKGYRFRFVSDNDGAVNGDPLFIGLKGQVFKFDGRSEAWYSNVATQQLQWNLQFGKFHTCPAGSDMFVTGTSMLFFDEQQSFYTSPANFIVIKIKNKENFYPGCRPDQNACLANGALEITLDGEDISMPGEYAFKNGYGRVISHNTFGACSRKWFDYTVSERARRSLKNDFPVNRLLENRDKMLDPEECGNWLRKRIANNDIYKQAGNWVTIYIETPLISFHVEYRKNKNDEGCMSQSIDAWVSNVAPRLEKETWQGILGETREPKFDQDGIQIISDRKKLLSAEDDAAYEVGSAFGREFKARKYKSFVLW